MDLHSVLYRIVLGVNYFSLFYVITVSTIYLIQLISASFGLRKYVRSLRYIDYRRFLDSEHMVPISLLVPAYNESATIVDSVKNLLSLDFPEYEVIVINDGSKDDTLQLLIDAFSLIPFPQPYKKALPTEDILEIYRSGKDIRLIVLNKKNGGKADALNAGVNVSSYPVVVTIDADSILEKSSLIKIIYSFVSDPTCIAVGGIVRIGSGCEIVDGQLKEVGLSKKPIIALQTTEYLRAFLTGRLGFDVMGMLLIISGAFGAFQKAALIEVGGYTRHCVGEDMELVIKLHRLMHQKKRKYSVRFLPDPICWTQPPERLSDLRKQRKRWHIGLIDSLLKHKDMLFRPKYGRIGMVCLPYYWIFELIGPVIETFGYVFIPISWLLGVVNVWFMVSFFLVAVLYGTILSVGALLLEENTFRKYPDLEQLLRLFFFSFIDNFGYRQLNTVYKVEAMFGFQKNRSRWGELKRKGFSQNARK
ncbi:MAG: glycosyltransferase family 2 protein [Eubacteriales bacterium]|nr:glycosyltransferase family 2 protein [Eubacteriales bacterium]